MVERLQKQTWLPCNDYNQSREATVWIGKGRIGGVGEGDREGQGEIEDQTEIERQKERER